MWSLHYVKVDGHKVEGVTGKASAGETLNSELVAGDDEVINVMNIYMKLSKREYQKN